MKKIIFAVLATIFAVHANAQKPYYTLEESSNDPFCYIELNYIYRAEQHIGQTVYEFAQQFELPVAPEQVKSVGSYSWGLDKTLNGFVKGFWLEFYYEVGDSNVMYSINIELDSPYTNHEDDPNSPLYRMSDEEVSWYTYYNTLFRNNTIKKIWVHKKKDGEYVTDTYNHFRDYYGISESMLEFFLTHP